MLCSRRGNNQLKTERTKAISFKADCFCPYHANLVESAQSKGFYHELRARQMDEMIDSMVNAKILTINLLYAGFGIVLIALQQTLDYTAALPHPTLAGIGLIASAIGGTVSWLWERRKNSRASLRTNIAFAMGIGILVGLVTYDYLITSKALVNLWLGCLIMAGFSNQLCWGFVALITRKKITEIFKIQEDEAEEK